MHQHRQVVRAADRAAGRARRPPGPRARGPRRRAQSVGGVDGDQGAHGLDPHLRGRVGERGDEQGPVAEAERAQHLHGRRPDARRRARRRAAASGVAQRRFRRQHLDQFPQRGAGGRPYGRVGVGEGGGQRRARAGRHALGERVDGGATDRRVGVGEIGAQRGEFGLLLGEGEEFEDAGGGAGADRPGAFPAVRRHPERAVGTARSPLPGPRRGPHRRRIPPPGRRDLLGMDLAEEPGGAAHRGVLLDRDEIRRHRPGRELHRPRGRTCAGPGGAASPSSSRLRVVRALVVEAPAGLRAGQRRPGGHLGAVADEADLGAAHQLVRRAGAHARRYRRASARSARRPATAGRPLLGGAT